MNRIASRAYLDGARGEVCKLNIVGVCNGDRATVVACHVHDEHSGRSIKASDISIVDGCFACHEVFDCRAKMPDTGLLIAEAEWHFYALRGIQRTLENRIQRGILKLTLDTERIKVIDKGKSYDAVQAKRKIVGRTLGKGRKLQSRGFGQ